MGCAGAIAAVTAPSAVAAAAAAAAGLYFYFMERYHHHASITKEEPGDGFNRLRTLKANWIARVNGGTTTKANQHIPKFAPEFDGLHCFETLVAPRGQ